MLLLLHKQTASSLIKLPLSEPDVTDQVVGYSYTLTTCLRVVMLFIQEQSDKTRIHDCTSRNNNHSECTTAADFCLPQNGKTHTLHPQHDNNRKLQTLGIPMALRARRK